jgi:hypothetical protein
MERSSPDTNADISHVETAPEKEDSDKSPSFVHYIVCTKRISDTCL